MSENVVRALRFVIGTVALAGVLFAFGTWRERTASPPPAVTAAPATAAPQATAPPLTVVTPPSVQAKPADYDRSCAASQPWGQQVRTPFVCIEAPAPGATVPNGRPFEVRGYAGGSFENNLIVEWQVTRADGSTPPGPVPRIAWTYSAPDLGMPGGWQLALTVGDASTPARVRLVVYFTSPRDGARVAEASVEVELR